MANRLTLVPGTSDVWGLVYRELVVDGHPLRELLDRSDAHDDERDRTRVSPSGDVVPVLVLNWPVAGTDGALDLLGDTAPVLGSGRVSFYVCPVCADIGCGAVSAVVQRSARTVVWRDFGWDTGWDDGEGEIRFTGGPFEFGRDEYDAELRRFVETYDAVRASVPAHPSTWCGSTWRV